MLPESEAIVEAVIDDAPLAAPASAAEVVREQSHRRAAQVARELHSDAQAKRQKTLDRLSLFHPTLLHLSRLRRLMKSAPSGLRRP